MMPRIGQFACIPVRVARDPRLRAADHRVLIAVASHADSDGRAHPSLACIATETGIARDNVPRSIARLEEFGYLRHQRHKRGPGLWDRSSYQIIFEDAKAQQSPPPAIEQVIEQKGGAARAIADSMLAVWREECGRVLPIPRSIDRERVIACEARFRDSFDRDPEQWRAYCRAITECSFCCGQGASGWRADFDWALKPKSIRSVLEGKYRDNRSLARPRGNGTYDGIPPLGPGGT